MAGILPRGRSGPEITPLYEQLDEPQGVGHLVMALAVERFPPEVVATLTRLAAETGVPAASPLGPGVRAAPAAGAPARGEGSGGA